MPDVIGATPLPAVTAAARYEVLAQSREGPLRRARECSALTIPSLLPPQGTTDATDLIEPYQSIGARGVNNLSSKLLLTLFPAGETFFRLTMDDFVVEELRQKNPNAQQFEDARAAFEEALSRIERAVVNRMEQMGTRAVNFEALRHLVVAGNGLIFVQRNGKQKFFPLDRYVVKRDLSGNVLEIITKETLAKFALPARVQALVAQLPTSDNSDEKDVDLYTWVKRTASGSWTVHQEVANQIVPGSEGTYPKDKCAWVPLRWTAVSGEDYGRSYCEEYIGDLRTVDRMRQAITDFAAAAAKVLLFVNESGQTEKREVAEADSGDVLDGDAKDVTVLMLEKFHDFQVAKAIADEARQNLEQAFLLASAVQRNAERVTAEEIRVMVGELEQVLGGTYTILGGEFQRPIVVCQMHQMQADNKLPHLPDNTVRPEIVTGLEGLGRASEAQRLDSAIAGAEQLFGPEALADYVNVGSYLKRKFAAASIDTEGLIRDEKDVQALRQQRAMQSMSEKVGPSLVGAATKGMTQGAPPSQQ